MAVSAGVQEARKKKQLERLAMKANMSTKEDTRAYADYYASQPMQVERTKQNVAFRVAREALVEANDVLEIARISGDGLEEAEHDQAVAALVAERSQPPARGPAKAGLTGA